MAIKFRRKLEIEGQERDDEPIQLPETPPVRKAERSSVEQIKRGIRERQNLERDLQIRMNQERTRDALNRTAIGGVMLVAGLVLFLLFLRSPAAGGSLSSIVIAVLIRYFFRRRRR